MTGPDERTLSDPRLQIATEVLRVHRESYGTGGGNATVHLLEDSVIVVIDDLELTPMERGLVDGGQREQVRHMRALYEEAAARTYSAIVEHATGRRVSSFLSSMAVDSSYSVQVFRTAA
jgi:uncharacterized protein YbcI